MTYFIDRFENQAAGTPNRIAIKTATESLTYDALNQRANALAQQLTESGVKPGDMVGILKHHSIDLVVAQLALWKIGAAFLMMNPNEQGNDAVIKRCKIAKVITDDQHSKQLDECVTPIIPTQELRVENPKRDPNSDNDLAYYISTSGTTDGVGKVMRINHTRKDGSGIVGCMLSTAAELEINENDTILCNTPQTFDPLIASLYGLLEGASLYMPTQSELENPDELYKNCKQHGVNVHTIVPNKIPALAAHRVQLTAIHHQKTLKFVPLGEKVTNQHIEQLDQFGSDEKPVIKVVCYGNSEGPIGQTATKHISGSPIVSIGKPMQGREIMIAKIDGKLARPAKPGERGILIYKSEGFGGYLDNPQATEDIQVIKVDADGHREAGWYTTGDEVAYEVDDNNQIVCDPQGVPIINIYGRSNMDFIKGPAATRLEVPTYAATVRDHPEVKYAESVVVAKSDRLNEIVTFVELEAESSLTKEALYRYLRHERKHNRVLTHKFVIMNKDDKLSNYSAKSEKLGREALVAAYKHEIHPYKVDDTIELRLRSYWQEILGINLDELNNSECQFKDLGGDSKSYAWLKALLADDPLFDLDSVNIDVEIELQFKKNPTLEHLAALIRLNQGRDKLVERYHSTRDTVPVIVIGEVSESEITALSSKQPIIHIKARENADRIEDYLKTLRYCQPSGPYFLVGTDQNDLDAIAAKLMQQHSDCIGMTALLNTEHLVEMLDQSYEAALERQALRRLERINYTITVNPHKATTKTLAAALKSHGLTKDMWHIVKQHKLTVNYEELLNNQQRQEYQTDPVLAEFGESITVEMSLQQHDRGYFTELCEKHTLQQAIELWYQQQIDKRFPYSSINTKAKLYERMITYARKLAAHMDDRGHCLQQAVPSLLNDRHAHDAAGAELFDEYDIDTKHCLYTTPLTRTQCDEGIELSFLNPEMYEYFKSVKEINNPYELMGTEQREAQLTLLEKLSTTHNSTSGNQPLCLFAPLTGDNDYAKAIAAFVSDRPIIAFKHPKMVDMDDDDFNSIEGLARYYVDCLLAHNPEGPFSLAGWSFGGLVAHEIARQLLELGYDIDYLGIIDSPSPSLIDTVKHYSASIFPWLCKVNTVIDEPAVAKFLEDHKDEKFDNFPEFAERWQQLVDVLADFPVVQAHVALCLQEVTAAHHYQQQNLLASIPNRHIYQATQDDEVYKIIPGEKLGWNVDNDHAHKITGATHFSIVKDTQFLKMIREHTAVDSDQKLYQRLQQQVNETLAQLETVTSHTIALHDIKTIIDTQGSSLVLGQSGIGKTTALIHTYQHYAKQFISSPASTEIPLYFSFSQHGNLKSFIDSLSLSLSQSASLNTKRVILFIDGLDEVSIDTVKETLEYLRSLNNTHLRVILSCKDDYYKSKLELQQLLHYHFKKSPLKAHQLKPLTAQQVDELLSETKANSTEDKDRVMEKIRQFATNEHITPLYVNKLVESFKSAQDQPTHLLGHVSFASLQELHIQQRAKESGLSASSIILFNIELALSKLNLTHPITRPKAATHWFTQLADSNRTDMKQLMKAMNLKQTATGLDFYHRSEYLYYIAYLCFFEIRFPPANYQPILNQFNLYDQYEILALINEIYYHRVFNSGLSKDEQDQLRQQIRHNLHDFINSARNNPENKIQAANALSLINACDDLELNFPTDLTDIHLAATNLANAVIDFDLTVAMTDIIITDGAVIKNPEMLPDTYEHRARHQVTRFNTHGVGFQRLSSGRIIFKSYIWHNSIKPSTFMYSYSRDQETDFGITCNAGKLNPPSIALAQSPGEHGQVIYHPDGEHTAIISGGTYNIFKRLSPGATFYNPGYYALQIFDRNGPVAVTPHDYTINRVTFNQLSNTNRDSLPRKQRITAVFERHLQNTLTNSPTYYLPKDDYSYSRRVTLLFHPTKIILFLLDYNKHFLAVFDPLVNSPTIQHDIWSTDGQLIINKQTNLLIHDHQSDYRLYICLRNCEPPYEIENTISYSDLIGYNPNYISSTYMIEIENTPFFAIAFTATRIPKDNYYLFIIDTLSSKVIASLKTDNRVEFMAANPLKPILALAMKNKIFTWNYSLDTLELILQMDESLHNASNSMIFEGNNLHLMATHYTKSGYKSSINTITPSTAQLRPGHPDLSIDEILYNSSPDTPVFVTRSEQMFIVWDSRTLTPLYKNTRLTVKSSPIVLSNCGKFLFYCKYTRIIQLDFRTGLKTATHKTIKEGYDCLLSTISFSSEQYRQHFLEEQQVIFEYKNQNWYLHICDQQTNHIAIHITYSSHINSLNEIYGLTYRGYKYDDILNPAHIEDSDLLLDLANLYGQQYLTEPLTAAKYVTITDMKNDPSNPRTLLFTTSECLGELGYKSYKFNTKTGELSDSAPTKRTYYDLDRRCNNFIYSPQRKYIIDFNLSDGCILIQNNQLDKLFTIEVDKPPGNHCSFSGIHISNDDNYLFIYHGGGYLICFDLANDCHEILRYQSPSGDISSLYFTSEQQLIIGTDNGAIYVVDLDLTAASPKPKLSAALGHATHNITYFPRETWERKFKLTDHRPKTPSLPQGRHSPMLFTEQQPEPIPASNSNTSTVGDENLLRDHATVIRC